MLSSWAVQKQGMGWIWLTGHVVTTAGKGPNGDDFFKSFFFFFGAEMNDLKMGIF